MPTASRCGTRRGASRSWRNADRPRSRPGPRSRSRPSPFTQLAAALRALVRFHQAHPGWFPPIPAPAGPPPLPPEWEAAFDKVYGPHRERRQPAGEFLTAEKTVRNGLETV
jgi:hypothetical protein